MLSVQEDEGEASSRSQNFAKQALEPLIPVLLAQLTKQEEDQDKDQGIWNLSMAAGTCLSLFAACVGDSIIGLVLPYVQVCAAACMLPVTSVQPYLQQPLISQQCDACTPMSAIGHLTSFLPDAYRRRCSTMQHLQPLQTRPMAEVLLTGKIISGRWCCAEPHQPQCCARGLALSRSCHVCLWQHA